MPHQSFDSQEDEITYILNETRRLEQLITQLHEERAALLRRLNAIRSLTTNLPAETLSYIFESACSASKPNDTHALPRLGLDDQDDVGLEAGESPFQLILSSVSSDWRQVVRSSPQLWDSISLNINPRTVTKCAAILRLFLLHSKTVPITLSLRFTQIMGPNAPYLVHNNVDNLLVANLYRIKELHLVHPPRRWHSYTHLLYQLTECSLDLERHETYNPDRRVILPLNAPLRRFTLQGALWRFDADFQLPCSAITSMTLSSIPPDLSIQAFIQCPNLVEFRCISCSDFLPPTRPVTLLNTVTFNRLEIFEWETKNTPWYHVLFRYLHVPVLQKMRWTISDDLTANAHLQAFLKRLPPTLTEIELFLPSHLDHIRDDLNIESLTITSCTDQDFLTIFRRLRPRWEEQHVIKPFPRLRKLGIGEGSNLGHLDNSYSIAVIEMLEGRLDHSNNVFDLDMPSIRIEWPSQLRTILARWRGAGFHVRIHERVGIFS